MTNKALGIIDVQRGFMPAAEGERLNMEGFGELGVPEGELIIPAINKLVKEYDRRGLPTFTTQDWHPAETAHFSEEPNFTTNWPVHCVGGTPGAELHPDLELPGSTVRFIKGFEPLERGEDDTSYSGFYAINPDTGEGLPQWLKEQGIDEVDLVGVAYEYCVGKTALDAFDKLDLDVAVATDGARGIAAPGIAAMNQEFAVRGIRTVTTADLLAEIGER